MYTPEAEGSAGSTSGRRWWCATAYHSSRLPTHSAHRKSGPFQAPAGGSRLTRPCKAAIRGLGDAAVQPHYPACGVVQEENVEEYAVVQRHIHELPCLSTVGRAARYRKACAPTHDHHDLRADCIHSEDALAARLVLLEPAFAAVRRLVYQPTARHTFPNRPAGLVVGKIYAVQYRRNIVHVIGISVCTAVSRAQYAPVDTYTPYMLRVGDREIHYLQWVLLRLPG